MRYDVTTGTGRSSMLSRDRARLAATAVVAGTCFILMVLSATGTLAYTQPSRLEQLEDLAEAHIWTSVFAVCAAVGALAFRRRELMVDSMSMSAGAIGAWAFINWMWGLTATSPVSLAGPTLATGLSLIAWALARSWAVADRGREG